MKPLLIAATLVAILCTAVTTLTAVVFCLGMGANASPAEIHALKLWMVGLSLLGVGGIGGGLLLLRIGRWGWAAGVSLFPSVIMVLILIIALLR